MIDWIEANYMNGGKLYQIAILNIILNCLKRSQSILDENHPIVL